MTVEKAIAALKAGELAVLPTETVYGIFADATNEAAVQKLYAVKGRPVEKALNMNVADYDTILKFSVHQPAYLEKLVKTFLPGPLTIIYFRSKSGSSRVDTCGENYCWIPNAFNSSHTRSN